MKRYRDMYTLEREFLTVCMDSLHCISSGATIRALEVWCVEQFVNTCNCISYSLLLVCWELKCIHASRVRRENW